VGTGKQARCWTIVRHMHVCSPPVKDKFTLLFVTQDGEAASSAQGVNCVPHHSFASCPLLDVLVVPGIEMYVFSCSSPEIERFLKY